MVLCPQCGRKLETAVEKCVCGFSLTQVSTTFTANRESPPAEAGQRTLHVPLAGPSANAQAKIPEEKHREAGDVASAGRASERGKDGEKPASASSGQGAGLHKEEEAQDVMPLKVHIPDKKALHEEEDAVDVADHEKVVGQEPESQEEKRRKAEFRRRHKILANLIGFGINAILLLVVILLVRCWWHRKPTEVTEEVRVTAPAKQESEAVVDSTHAPPPPPVSDQGEPKNPEGSQGRAIEDALRAQNALQCRIEVLKFTPEDGKLFMHLHKEARWDNSELKKSLHHDALLILRTAFLTNAVKSVIVEIEAPPARKAGQPPGELEKVLTLEVDRAAYESSGLAQSGDTTIPLSLNPHYNSSLGKMN